MHIAISQPDLWCIPMQLVLLYGNFMVRSANLQYLDCRGYLGLGAWDLPCHFHLGSPRFDCLLVGLSIQSALLVSLADTHAIHLNANLVVCFSSNMAPLHITV